MILSQNKSLGQGHKRIQ